MYKMWLKEEKKYISNLQEYKVNYAFKKLFIIK